MEDFTYPYYTVEFNDGEFFSNASSLEEAREIRSMNNFNYFSRSLHVYANYRDHQERVD